MAEIIVLYGALILYLISVVFVFIGCKSLRERILLPLPLFFHGMCISFGFISKELDRPRDLVHIFSYIMTGLIILGLIVHIIVSIAVTNNKKNLLVKVFSFAAILPYVICSAMLGLVYLMFISGQLM